ncbi:MAG: hypothetical protein FWE31_01490 [Firmicutes bacterium]|nr:hypothetical protein [Bacillota bacterium]
MSNIYTGGPVDRNALNPRGYWKEEENINYTWELLDSGELVGHTKQQLEELVSTLDEATLFAGALRCLIYWYDAENVQEKLFPKIEAQSEQSGISF